MLTKRDLTQLKDIFVTKAEFNDVKNLFMNRFDELLFELKAMREEMTLFGYRQGEHSQTLENHESRLSTLESKIH